ncbi:hypothetical protein AtNW77_Chr2g0235601 [Arabidopsis thaliana]|uniref:Uncharacterized protein n=3 Tax=Arabidopsis TaxID=3701 RepID=A0A654EYW7_ARATH|nr:hypothetical protein ISN45_At02g011570 [Arabidopsis thaliana x Arabidopsis arenosa]KAG7641159.1 hypothetical protein ISN44_As02g012030 [Arabidopsis suecica]VYS52692.1 unnamed protein product [Arabidopsis thaliana]
MFQTLFSPINFRETKIIKANYKRFHEIRAKVQTETNDALNENEISAIKKSGFRGHVDISYKSSASFSPLPLQQYFTTMKKIVMRKLRSPVSHCMLVTKCQTTLQIGYIDWMESKSLSNIID